MHSDYIYIHPYVSRIKIYARIRQRELPEKSVIIHKSGVE